MELMKVMDKHKNIINLLGVCTQDGMFLTRGTIAAVVCSWNPLINNVFLLVNTSCNTPCFVMQTILLTPS